MKDIVTAILADDSARDAAAVEDALLSQAAAIPWANDTV